MNLLLVIGLVMNANFVLVDFNHESTLSEMSPTWRGSSLNYPKYPAQTLEEIGILIGNKRPEAFKLEIDKILLK